MHYPTIIRDDTDDESTFIENDSRIQAVAKGGVACPFPWRVHQMLEVTAKEGLEDIVSWCPHGRAFAVWKPTEFVDKVLLRFFSQSKYPSFQRQLNLYGFSRFAHGVDKGAYYHPCFLRGKPSLVQNMVRRKIKGTKVRRTPTAEEEPNFYSPEWKLEESPVTVHRESPVSFYSSTMTASRVVLANPVTPPMSPVRAAQVNHHPEVMSSNIFELTRKDMTALEQEAVALFEDKPFFLLDELEEEAIGEAYSEAVACAYGEAMVEFFAI